MNLLAHRLAQCQLMRVLEHQPSPAGTTDFPFLEITYFIRAAAAYLYHYSSASFRFSVYAMDSSFQYIFAIVAVLCAIVGLYKRSRRLPLPPGPNPLPILKNVLDMPSTYQWRTFDKWFKEYGTDNCFLSGNNVLTSYHIDRRYLLR